MRTNIAVYTRLGSFKEGYRAPLQGFGIPFWIIDRRQVRVDMIIESPHPPEGKCICSVYVAFFLVDKGPVISG